MTTEEFINRAKQTHGDKYDYSHVVYVNAKTKVCVICPEHGEFYQRASNHISGQGCPICADKQNSKRLLTWTKDKCYIEAQKYKSKAEFRKDCPSGYSSAQKHGWLTDYKWFQTTYRTPSGYWTKKRVFEEARKYKTRHMFYEGCRGGYGAAERNGWFEEMTWFEEPNPNKPRVWTKEAVFSLAKTCSTKLELRKANKGAYNVAWKNGWLAEMNWLDVLTRDPYTKDEVFSIAHQYRTKSEFRKAVPNVYNAAQKKGWLYEITWFMTSPKYDQHNYCVYVYVDEDNKVAYVGLTVNKSQRHYSHSTGYNRNGKISRSPVYRYFQSSGRIVPNPKYLEEWLTADEAREKEHEWRMKYQDMGYRLLNIAKTGAGIGSLGGVPAKWTKPRVFKEAQKYQSRTEFASKCTGAYAVACKRGWIEQMPWMRAKWWHPTPRWTREAVFEESKKYSTRREFEINSSGAYSKALAQGWLDEMPWLELKRKSWTREEVFEESRKYNSRVSFSKGAVSAYDIARREKWLDEMPWLVKLSHGKWTKEDVFMEAKKYPSRKAFRVGNETAYRTALKNHWMDELFPKRK